MYRGVQWDYETMTRSIINQVMLVSVLREVVELKILVKEGSVDNNKVEYHLSLLRDLMTEEVNAKIADVTAQIAAETKGPFPEDRPRKPGEP